jgi:hypothetical protein
VEHKCFGSSKDISNAKRELGVAKQNLLFGKMYLIIATVFKYILPRGVFKVANSAELARIDRKHFVFTQCLTKIRCNKIEKNIKYVCLWSFHVTGGGGGGGQHDAVSICLSQVSAIESS